MRIEERERARREERAKKNAVTVEREEIVNNSWLKRIRREVECCVWREEKKEECPREQRTECSFLNPRKKRVFKRVFLKNKKRWCLCQENEKRDCGVLERGEKVRVEAHRNEGESVREKGNGQKRRGTAGGGERTRACEQRQQCCDGRGARTESDTVRVSSKKEGFVGEVRENVVCGRGEERRGEETLRVVGTVARWPWCGHCTV
jgi:hypothetical protein